MPVWMYDCQSGNVDQYGEKAEDNANTCEGIENVVTSIDMELNLEVDLFKIAPRLQQQLSSAQACHESEDDIVSD